MRKIINKTQQKIYAIWRKAKQYISSFVGGQFKKRENIEIFENDKFTFSKFYKTFIMTPEENKKYIDRNLQVKGMLNTPIYRVYKWEYLKQLFDYGEDTLVRPELWDDPFENVLFKNPIQFSDEKITFSKIRYESYGQCWSYNTEETDAMWRIYSPNKDGVRVKTTIGKLWKNFHDINNPHALLTYFLNDVIYLNENEIYNELNDYENVCTILPSFDFQRRYLHIKRKEYFEYEDELRLVMYNPDNVGDICKYKLNPFEIFDELVFDSRFDNNKFQRIKYDLEQSGFNKRILKSTVYDLPKLNMVFDKPIP